MRAQVCQQDFQPPLPGDAQAVEVGVDAVVQGGQVLEVVMRCAHGVIAEKGKEGRLFGMLLNNDLDCFHREPRAPGSGSVAGAPSVAAWRSNDPAPLRAIEGHEIELAVGPHDPFGRAQLIAGAGAIAAEVHRLQLIVLQEIDI
ncbi:hypothetical protein D9M70_430680 [compost metagenome]